MKQELIFGLLMLLAAPVGAGQIDTRSTSRALEEANKEAERFRNYQQRERFHEDYEIDRRQYGVNPQGRDATGAEVDGESGDE